MRACQDEPWSRLGTLDAVRGGIAQGLSAGQALQAVQLGAYVQRPGITPERAADRI